MKTRAIIVLTGLALLFATSTAAREKTADTFDPVGPFEIVTHTIHYTTGWNEGRLGRGTTETYGLRYRGKPLTFEGKAGMFGDDTMVYDTMNSVITFPASEPAIIVNVGDPNNSSFYYLVREKDGKASIEYLGDGSGGVSVDWVDPRSGSDTNERELAVHRKHLEGGRFLLLGEFCVFDVEMLEAHRFGYEPGASNAQFKTPIAMSPDETSFVRFGFDRENEPVLIVYDFVDAKSYAVSIDQGVQRFSDMEEIDAEWLEYYFEWIRVEGKHDWFVGREGVTPRPWRGRLTVDPHDGYREYRVQPVREEMNQVVVDFLQSRMGAELLPRAQYSTSDSLKVGDRVVNVMFWDDHVGIWMDRGTDSSFVEEIGKGLDQALATGEYDEYFLFPPRE